MILNVDDVPAAPRPETIEDRWILSRLGRATTEITELLESFHFSRASLHLYDVLWGEVCDWYIELVKPRLYEDGADKDALSANLLHVLETVLKLMHPLMPFVTEEIWSFLPGERGLLAAADWPSPARRPTRRPSGWSGDLIEAVSAVRRWRDEVGVKAATRVRRGWPPTATATAVHLERLARFELVDGRARTATWRRRRGLPGGAVQVLPSADV